MATEVRLILDIVRYINFIILYTGTANLATHTIFSDVSIDVSASGARQIQCLFVWKIISLLSLYKMADILADNIFKSIFLYEDDRITIQI